MQNGLKSRKKSKEEDSLTLCAVAFLACKQKKKNSYSYIYKYLWNQSIFPNNYLGQLFGCVPLLFSDVLLFFSQMFSSSLLRCSPLLSQMFSSSSQMFSSSLLRCSPLLSQMFSSSFLRCSPLLFPDAALLQSAWSRGLYTPGKKLLEAGAGLFKWGCLDFLGKLGEPSLWIQWPQDSTSARS